MKYVKLMGLGASLSLSAKGAEYLFYLTDNPMLNLWVLYALLLVLWFIIVEAKKVLFPSSKK